jgi:endonuclease YncB( thermonuclease family)
LTSEKNPLPVYLYFLDGTMVQEWLLKQGYATIDKMSDNKYEEEFLSVLQSD